MVARSRLPGRLPLLAALALLGGCAKPAPLPPVAPAGTGTHLVGKFIWRDLFTADAEAAERFYGALFGWQFETVTGTDARYRLARLDGRPVAGIVSSPKSTRGIWVSHLSVPDVDAAVAALTAGGGKVEFGPKDIPGRGRTAIVTDAKGAVVALTRTTQGDPGDDEPASRTIFWTELWAHAPTEHAGLYRALVGWQAESREIGTGATYTVLSAGGKPRAGLIKSPVEDVPATWLPYVKVDDPAGTAKRAAELGARVLVQPSAEVRGGNAALLVDPTGAPLAIQRWPLQ